MINKGPWSRLDHNRPFLAAVPEEKPAEANFYPAGATKDQVEKWMATLPPDERRKARGFFTTIRRAPGPPAPFVPIPYSLEYQGELGIAARLLREAAALTTQPTLKKFLETRADAFLTDDYYASDVAWMELDASIEPTIGPYETYEDEWFNFKAAFEAFIAVRDDAETAKLAAFGAELQEIEDHLPIDPTLRNPQLGSLAPIRVVNVIFTAGDANRGVQTAAYNLPNDERVVKERGSKRVMLKNVQEAKFSVEMPTTPAASTLTTGSFIGDVTSHLFTSWEGNAKFTVDYSPIPRFALEFAGADTIYDHARGALLKQTWSKPVSFLDVTVNGRTGKQLQYDTPPIPGKSELSGMASFFLVGERLYVVDAIVPAGASEDDAKRFLASIRFE